MLSHLLLALGGVAILLAALKGATRYSTLHLRHVLRQSTVLSSYASVLALFAGSLLGLTFVLVAFSPSPDSAERAQASPPASTVTLPIEVIGPDGTTESITVQASDVSDVDSLYLRAYSIGYPYFEQYDVNKASIRLNGGTWTDLTDAVATCKFPESQWECIDGPYHTIRFEVAVSDLGSLQDGANTVSFRFNYAFPSDSPDSHGDVSTGYRILDLEFRTSSDTDAIDGTTFEWDDPGSWTAPDGYDTQADVDDGGALWHERDILVDGWNGPEIRASCADCHAKDGRDLAYFAFSNHSIIERSEFHGLSEAEGKKIAAYIRSYVLEDPDDGETYEAPGRPWDPPYQPGPTALASRSPNDARDAGQPFSSLSSQMWAAGAGADWALERDEEMWPYVKGDNRTFTYEDVSVESILNMRELPVNLQMPDWNEWLPRHHPLDLFGSDFENGHDGNDPWGAYSSSEPYWTFHTFEECWDATGGDPSQCGDKYFQAVKGLYSDAREFQRDVGGSVTATANYDDLEDGRLASALMKWQAVKQWELVHTYDMADEGEHWRSEVEALTWISDARQVYDIPPHISGPHVGPRNEEYDLYLDNAWYQLQTVLNSGRGIGTGIRPTDWRYHFMHMNQLEKDLGIEHSMRFITAFVKVNQNCDVDGMYDNSESPKSWYFRRGHCDFGAELWRRNWVYPKTDAVTGGRALKVYEEVLRANFRGFGKYPEDDWARQYGEDGWEPSSFTPSLDDPWYDDNETPSHYYRTLDEMSQRNASPALLDDIARWGEMMNPNGNWEQWMISVDAQTIGLRPGWNVISSRVAPSPDELETVFQDVTVGVVKDETGDVFIPSDDRNEIGDWTSTEAYKVYTDTDQSLTIEGSSVDATTEIPLQEGWNLVPYLPDASQDIATALESIRDNLVMVKDEAGNTYVPAYSIDQIGAMQPDKGYQIYVDAPATLVYPQSSKSRTASTSAEARTAPNGQ